MVRRVAGDIAIGSTGFKPASPPVSVATIGASPTQDVGGSGLGAGCRAGGIRVEQDKLLDGSRSNWQFRPAWLSRRRYGVYFRACPGSSVGNLYAPDFGTKVPHPDY